MSQSLETLGIYEIYTAENGTDLPADKRNSASLIYWRRTADEVFICKNIIGEIGVSTNAELDKLIEIIKSQKGVSP